MSLQTHLECAACGKHADHQALANLCEACGKPLLARYDLDRARTAMTFETVRTRPPSLWRYSEVLPDSGLYQTLGEGFTPLLPARRLGQKLGLKHLFIKDESVNPTGSFKARGLAAAVAAAHRLGARALCLPSAGNAASAAAAYGAWVGLPVHVFLPEETPAGFFSEVAAYGATVHKVKGHIGDAGKAMRAMMDAEPEGGWFDLSTLKEPYRLEGKKTMGYELSEQMDRLPDVIIYPTGGGTGLIGMWKAFAEMHELGWIGDERPRMVSVQSSGCAPIPRAFDQGAESAEAWENPMTVAAGLCVPAAIGDFLILRAVRESGGCALAVEEDALIRTVKEVGSLEGILMAPEGAATVLGLRRMIDEGTVSANDRVVLFNTGTGLKYLDSIAG